MKTDAPATATFQPRTFHRPVPHRIIAPASEEWPVGLDELGSYPTPKRLFVCGKPLAPFEGSVAIVGTRRPTAAGIDMTKTLSTGLAEAGFAVVSGLAMGIDAAAHRAALEAGGVTVAVVGAGLQVNYPERNEGLRGRIEEFGTVLSEYEPEEPPLAWHFPQRNRIIAGLCCAVIVVEGGLKSGALITARTAIDANRTVFAVPGSVRNAMSTGPNELIRTGQAALVTDIEQVFQELSPNGVTPRTPAARAEVPELSDDERLVLFALDDVPSLIEDVAMAGGVAVGASALALTRLELRGLARRRFDGYEISQTGANVRRNMVNE